MGMAIYNLPNTFIIADKKIVGIDWWIGERHRRQQVLLERFKINSCPITLGYGPSVVDRLHRLTRSDFRSDERMISIHRRVDVYFN